MLSIYDPVIQQPKYFDKFWAWSWKCIASSKNGGTKSPSVLDFLDIATSKTRGFGTTVAVRIEHMDKVHLGDFEEVGL